ncbi:DHA2 family efflux MFS transporter permease subunit [Kurthia massiliensis]|uniref:DHA2 family efflux MFS transporter permease subunit n=1 Tax=Kurthia massiliensis TaxID=1033739 RepID=UPI00028A24F7|nr:DHA2 family efflux MFS transporter permease subunit [Kurthia massiliensis]
MSETMKKPPYLMIAILFVGAFVAFLNNTLLNVALPSIMKDFDVEASTVQWLATGYMLVTGILVPASAFLITRFKNKSLFVTSMAIFTIGTALAIFAPEFWVLLTARMIQAAGAAVMGPLLMNVMLASFPIEKRGAALGIFGLVMIMAPAIGPTLSGYLVENYSWHYLFIVILPFSIISLLLALFKFDNIMPTRHVTIDVFSIILSTIGFGGLLYGFSTASSAGWDALEVWGTIVVGTIALIVFVIRQLKLEKPLLSMETYKHPMYTLSSIISVVNAMALFSGMILLPLYVQNIRGIEPFDAGLMLLPGALIMGLMSPITGKLFDKIGPRPLAITGIVIIIVTTYLLSKLEIDTTYTYLIIVYSVRMLGISLVMMPIMTNGLNQLPQRLNPHGTAINNTLQQVAGAIGTAVMVTIMTKKATSSAEDMDIKKTVAEKAKDKAMSLIQGGTDQAEAQAQAAKYAKDLAATMAKQAQIDGINFSFLIATGISVVSLILSFFLKRVTQDSIKIDAKQEQK